MHSHPNLNENTPAKWTNRPNWTNCQAVIIASGPSLTQEQANLTQGQKVIAINDNYRLTPWADILYACDHKWWQWHHEQTKFFKGIKVTQDKKAAQEYDINYIESAANTGLSTDPDIIHQGFNSGYQAINLAYNLGARKIILIGYDMKLGADGSNHWFGHHPDKIVSHYQSWLIMYSSLAEHAKKLNCSIINSTIDTALTCFEKMPLEDALNVRE